MSDLLQLHPEINNFDADRFVLSPSTADYINRFRKDYPELNANLGKFAHWFSSLSSLAQAPEILRELDELPMWTFTKQQREAARQQLAKALQNYPVPTDLRGRVTIGTYLDLRAETDIENYQEALRTFGTAVREMHSPAPVPDFDISTIGQLPLQLLHDSSEPDGLHDPLLGAGVARLWTLDVTHNPGVSIKDVMARSMIEDALASGALSSGGVIVEGTSGNTGAGLALVALHLGIKIILVIPDKMSQEKIDRLRWLGAHVVVTPTKVEARDPRSYYSVRDFLAAEIEGWRAGQYDNLANRRAHEQVTGPLIWDKTGGEVTAVVATAGTCGTISGIGRYLKSRNPEVKMIAVDTVGSILYLLKEGYTISQVEQYAKGYTIQGFGEDIHPQNLDLEVVDRFVRISDKTGLNLTRQLPTLGAFYGQSSGATYAAVLELIKDGTLTGADKVVLTFPDYGLAYRGDVYSDNWMRDKNVLY